MLLTDFSPLSPAEKRLIEESRSPDRITVGDGELPESESPENLVRAGLLRAILIGQEKEQRLHDKGLRLRGAWIKGALDLQGSTISHDLSLTQCHLTDSLELVNARLRGVYLSGCVLVGLSGDNAIFDGSLFLRSGTVVNGEISLSGARIRGDMQFCDIELASTRQDAIFAPSLIVEGSAYLGNYPYSNGVTTLVAQGAIFLASAKIENDAFITNCAISPQSKLTGEQIFHASEEHGPEIALSLARARIGGILYFKDNQIARGVLSLAGATAKRLRDEPHGPGASYPIRLDGFEYSDFSRHAETDLKARLEWLERRPADTPFTAQPYEQLARVLMHLGHRNDARTVLMCKEKILRNEARQHMGHSWRWPIALVGDAIIRFAVGYGYRPARVLVLAIVLVLGLGAFFQAVWNAGDMTPNAAPILVSQDWVAATRQHPENPGKFWSQKGQAGQDWETFNGFAYAADLVIPIVSLGQETAWAPSTSRSALGRAGWCVRWFAKAAGWIITALGAAAVTGAVRQD